MYPMTDSLSGYVSVSLHHTPIDVVGEGTEVSLQAAGEKSHIHQFARGSTTNAEIPASLSSIKAFIGSEISRRAVWAG